MHAGDYRRRIARELRRLGAVEIAFSNRKKHDRVTFCDRRGRLSFYVIARSPSDHRALKNALAELRRLFRETEMHKSMHKMNAK